MKKLLNERPLVSGLVIGIIAGILLGVLYAWQINPVKWTDASPTLLRDDFKSDYVKMTAELYAQTGLADVANGRLVTWPDGGLQYVCQVAQQTPGGPDKQKLLTLADAIQPGVDCEQAVAAAPAEEEAGSLLGRVGVVCGAGLLSILVVGGLFFFIYRRGTRREEGEMQEGMPAASLGAGAGRTIPLAQFPTEFNIGHDTYDDSFSIETATGEFLGECGVGISEAIGIGSPKKVTAFEVWLFDKNDIRTVTKVIMSEHAYYDEALRAKLAPKGEAVLAKPDETIVLETASLIINARVVEMKYGTGELPAQSFFERMVVELAAWAKEIPELAEAAPADEFAL